jgi:hypothetical protein
MPTAKRQDHYGTATPALGAPVGDRLAELARRAATEPHALGLDGAKTEKQFQAEVVYVARRFGWREYHTHDSRKSRAGWPDLVLCRPPVLVFAELKVPPNKATPEQEQWLADLRACPGVEVYLWTPSSWPEIERVLA